jgi:hypothetical protein
MNNQEIKNKSGGGPPQSKTLARHAAISERREASWSAPVLPPSRRAKAPLRRDGGWRFEIGQKSATTTCWSENRNED